MPLHMGWIPGPSPYELYAQHREDAEKAAGPASFAIPFEVKEVALTNKLDCHATPNGTFWEKVKRRIDRIFAR